MPEPQNVQEAEPPVEYFPGSQLVQPSEPETENFPGSHKLQEFCAPVLYLPDSHGEQQDIKLERVGSQLSREGQPMSYAAMDDPVAAEERVQVEDELRTQDPLDPNPGDKLSFP